MRKRAKKSIANFGLRQGQEIGAAVTLRGARMWEFLDRFISVAIPRIRDFRGLSTRSFDGRGNYSLGVKEQMIFPEINYDMVEQIHGMDITFVTTATRDDHARWRCCGSWACRFKGEDREGRAPLGAVHTWRDCDGSKAMIEKSQRKPKFARAAAQPLWRGAGVSRAYLRRFGLCRICFRELALNGMIPGVRKASW